MKHKLLQTWARKSAKLLAAVALLATTSFGANAENSVTLTFKCGQSKGNTIGGTNATTISYMFDSASQSLIESLSDAANLNGGATLNGNNAVRFGSYSSGTYSVGSLTINLKQSYKIKSTPI